VRPLPERGRAPQLAEVGQERREQRRAALRRSLHARSVVLQLLLNRPIYPIELLEQFYPQLRAWLLLLPAKSSNAL